MLQRFCELHECDGIGSTNTQKLALLEKSGNQLLLFLEVW